MIPPLRNNVYTDLALHTLLPMAAGTAFYFIPAGGIVRNYLPDALWAYGMISCMLIIWQRQFNLLWLGLSFAFFIVFELLQHTGVIYGTADPLDVVVYCLAGSIALVLNPILNVYKN